MKRNPSRGCGKSILKRILNLYMMIYEWKYSHNCNDF